MSVHLTGYEVSSQSRITPTLSWNEQECLMQLIALPFDPVLDCDREDQACTKLGQRFFDKFKAESRGNSLMAKAGLERIHRAISDYSRERMKHVSRSWEGVGDFTWQWKHLSDD